MLMNRGLHIQACSCLSQELLIGLRKHAWDYANAMLSLGYIQCKAFTLASELNVEEKLTTNGTVCLYFPNNTLEVSPCSWFTAVFIYPSKLHFYSFCGLFFFLNIWGCKVIIMKSLCHVPTMIRSNQHVTKNIFFLLYSYGGQSDLFQKHRCEKGLFLGWGKPSP